MITQQLQRNRVNDGRYSFIYPGQLEIGDALTFIHLYPLAGEGNQLAAAIGPRPRNAVAILTGNFYLTRQPCLILYPVPSHKTGVTAGAAGDDVDVLDVFQPGFCLRTEDGGEYVILAQCASQRIGYGDRLFVDFLEHEVAVLALLLTVSGVLVAQYRVVHRSRRCRLR